MQFSVSEPCCGRHASGSHCYASPPGRSAKSNRKTPSHSLLGCHTTYRLSLWCVQFQSHVDKPRSIFGVKEALSLYKLRRSTQGDNYSRAFLAANFYYRISSYLRMGTDRHSRYNWYLFVLHHTKPGLLVHAIFHRQFICHHHPSFYQLFHP